MEKANLDERYLISILTLFILGNTTVLSGIREAKSDIYIIFIISSIFSILLFYFYSFIFEKCKKEGMFKVLENTFGKFITKIITLCYTFFGLFICMISSCYSVTLIKNNDLERTPKILIGLFLAYLCYKALTKKPIVLSKWCMLFFPLIVLVVILPTILSVKLFKFSNLIPIFQESSKTLISSTIYLIAVPFGEAFMSLDFIIKNSSEKVNIKKVLFISLGISSFIILLIYLRNVLILGGNSLAILDYPTYLSTSLIKMGDYFQRFEVFVTTSMILNNFVNISLVLYFVNNALIYIFNINNNANFFAPLILLSIGAGTLLFELVNFNIVSTKDYYITSFIFTVILPIILVLISYFIKFIKEKLIFKFIKNNVTNNVKEILK